MTATVIHSLMARHVTTLRQNHMYVLGSKSTRLILGLRPANERRRYFVMTSLIGWV